MSGRKKKFPRFKGETEYTIDEGTMRRGRGRPRKDGHSPVPRRRRPIGDDDDDSSSVTMDSSSPAPDTIPVLHLKATEGAPGEFDNQTASCESMDGLSDARMDLDQGLDSRDSSYERMMTDADLALNQPENEPHAQASQGMLCSLCCCGEKSLLGQGDLLRFDPTPGFNPFKKPLPRQRKMAEEDAPYNPNDRSPKHLTWRRARGPSKIQKEKSKSPRRIPPDNLESGSPGVDELGMVGHQDEPDVHVTFELSGHTTAHHCCAAWSDGVCQNENFQLLNVDKAVFAGTNQRCSYCRRFGATIFCMETGCKRVYHYPYAASSGSFQGIKSLALLCPEHLDLCEDKVDEEELECVICEAPGTLQDQLFCTSCGQHYHSTCLDPPVVVTPGVRAGWQCPNCKICQTCRQPGDDNKMLVCDTCDKGYHTFCLRPAMTTIPKHGWKCKNCRVCGDCGARTPGSGPSSRWHHNYTVCDSCYQQRNKGYFCPICGKAYRHHTTHKVMVQCDLCKRYIHADCDNSDVVTNYQQMRAAGQRCTYECRDCRQRQSNLEIGSRFSETRSSSTTLYSDSSCTEAGEKESKMQSFISGG